VNFVFVIIVTTLNSMFERSLTWIIASLESCFTRFFPRDKQSSQPPALSCQSASRSVSSPLRAILSWPSSGKRYRLPHPLPLPLCQSNNVYRPKLRSAEIAFRFIPCFVLRAFARFCLSDRPLNRRWRARQAHASVLASDPWRRHGYDICEPANSIVARSVAAGGSSDHLVIAVPSHVRVLPWFVRSFVGVGVRSIEKHRHACASDRARPRSLASTRWEREHCVLFAALSLALSLSFSLSFSLFLSLSFSVSLPSRYRLPVFSLPPPDFPRFFCFVSPRETVRPTGAPRKRILRVEKFRENRHVLWAARATVPLETLR